MAHDAQSAGAASDAIPMDIDSGTRGLAQSCHHPLSGLGSVNVEAVGTEATTARERVPKHLIADYEKIACLVTPSALESVWKVCLSMLEAEATRVKSATTNTQRRAPNNDIITADSLKKSIEKAVQKALRAPPAGGTTWAAVAARGGPKTLIKGTSINSTVSKRSPAEIVKAVNTALKAEVAVAARRLQTGDTIVTFRDSSSRPQTEDWVQPRLDLTQHVVVKGFPVRLSQNQDREDIRRKLAAANGPGIARATTRKPKGTATRAPLIIGVDSLDAANRLIHSGVVFDSEIFEAEPFHEGLRPRQCYNCHKLGHIAAHCSATAAKHPSEQECPALHGTAREKCPNCSGAHPAWSRLCPVANSQWTQARTAYPNRPREFLNPQKDDDPFTEGRRPAGDDLSPEASPRKRTRFILSRPPAPKTATTPNNSQLPTQ
ncbi:hypothetical protein E4U39_006928 [Claviceps sp. Clav50 group G5]|nr:hypothetical protein E4U39_006928 [Claviceps sp. Clav50 group G5]